MHEEGKMLAVDQLPAQQVMSNFLPTEQRIDKASLPAPGSVQSSPDVALGEKTWKVM